MGGEAAAEVAAVARLRARTPPPSLAPPLASDGAAAVVAGMASGIAPELAAGAAASMAADGVAWSTLVQAVEEAATAEEVAGEVSVGSTTGGALASLLTADGFVARGGFGGLGGGLADGLGATMPPSARLRLVGTCGAQRVPRRAQRLHGCGKWSSMSHLTLDSRLQVDENRGAQSGSEQKAFAVRRSKAA